MPARLPKALGWTGAAVAVAATGWAAWSALAVDHRRPLGPALAGERRRVRSVVGGTIAWYADDGAPGRPLLLVHSVNAAASAYEVKPLFERYAGRRPVHALDLPGFGFSERGDRPYSPQMYAQALIDWIELGVEAQGGVDVVAMSLSCEFVALAALWRPDLFHRLVFLSPTGFDAGPTRPPHLPRLPGRILEQAFFDLIASKGSIRWYLAKSFVGPVDDGLAAYAYDSAHQRGARFAPQAFLSGALFTPDIRHEVYRRLPQPVLVIYDEDPYVGFDGLDEMREQHNWHLARVAPTRGLPHWDQLEHTITALDKFWRTT